MGIGASVFLIALGAILTWGVTISTPGLDLDVVGVVLMLVGLVGLGLSLLFWSEWAPWGPARRRRIVRETELVEDPHHVRTTRTHRHDHGGHVA